ncbi:uncharacterized protein LOC142165790 [Nicotiana tabacum]|uniref:Uncharacterized protein LOC142165790 n=1 Tax=Nicotiana tabacum TaxID=4097 RepID=A0AC58S5M5_TOBAC
MAFSPPLGTCSSNVAKAKTVLIGLTWCNENDFFNIIIEGNSLLIINMLKGSIKSPWHVLEIVLKTQELARMANCSFQHSFREANQVADALAKWSIENIDKMLDSSIDLPLRARGL